MRKLETRFLKSIMVPCEIHFLVVEDGAAVLRKAGNLMYKKLNIFGNNFPLGINDPSFFSHVK